MTGHQLNTHANNIGRRVNEITVAYCKENNISPVEVHSLYLQKEVYSFLYAVKNQYSTHMMNEEIKLLIRSIKMARESL